MMDDNKESISSKVTWFVGASYGGTDDQTQRFLSEGIWENGYDDRYLNEVRSMRPGERIAIKSTYVRKRGLPFDNRGQVVSVMAIKAVGTITENLNDGKRVKVDWTKVEPIREWYFQTYRFTISRILPGEWATNGLIAFTFENKTQDIERFRNAPYWRERFGTTVPDAHRFGWTKFYQAIADKLLTHRNNRSALVECIKGISERVEGLGHLAEDQYADGSIGFVKDICPFTTMGLFNRGITLENRRKIAAELAKFLDVDEPVPETFDGVPLLNNLRSWYFPFEKNRASGHINALWHVFATGIEYADSDNEDASTEFAKAFDGANALTSVAWNLTFGLYWSRPWAFLSLDENSRNYIIEKLGLEIGRHGPKKRCNAADYIALMNVLEPRFQEAAFSVHSYPSLSQEAKLYQSPTAEKTATRDDKLGKVEDGEQSEVSVDTDEATGPEEAQAAVAIEFYSIDNILKEGCFFERSEIDRYLNLLRNKKNLILQGPPGTGKTWLAKRLAFALIGQKDESKVRAVQFHPNLSYEDFVRGWRPTGEGKLTLADGVFMEAIKAAANAPKLTVVVVIEEINRGNPAQIFGELLTLLEAGKRTPDAAIELCYADADGKRRPVHIPENLYLVGTMNVADRSLALVDLALRRRFAFVGLEPTLGKAWRAWAVNECAIDPNLVDGIQQKMVELNEKITADTRLGKQFRIGHSYVTPTRKLEPGETKKWFQQVIETEIGPLLDEYWYDAPDEAIKACEQLKRNW